MRVLVAEALFAQEVLEGPLLALVLACGFSWSEHHRVVIERNGSGAYDRWRADLPERSREEVEWLMEGWAKEEVQPALGGGQPWTVRLLEQGPAAWNTPEMLLGVFQAFDILSRPFEIHVEDDLSDRAFLLSIAKPQWRDRIKELEKAGRIIFFHGGGVGNMLRRVERFEGGAMPRRLRIWAMFDSDGMRPGGRSAVTRNLRAAAGHLLAGRWMLERRFVESYVPEKRLERWAQAQNQETTFAAWKGLDEDHQRHFNMKKGLGKDRNQDDFRGKNADFWSDHVNDPDLQNGFGRALATVFEGRELSWAYYDQQAREEADLNLGDLLRML